MPVHQLLVIAGCVAFIAIEVMRAANRDVVEAKKFIPTASSYIYKAGEICPQCYCQQLQVRRSTTSSEETSVPLNQVSCPNCGVIQESLLE